MKTDIFPLNYFTSIFRPTNMFTGRHQLNWFQIIIVFLFLNGLILIPVSLNFAKMDTFQIDDTYPFAFELIDDTTVNSLESATFSEGEMEHAPTFYHEKATGVIGGNLSEEEAEEALEKENAVLFQVEGITIKEAGEPIATIKYTADFDLSGVTDEKELKAAISNQWFTQNKAIVVGGLLFAVFNITFASLLFFVIGASFFIYLTKRGQTSSIRTYKESVNLIVNTLGLATLIAMIVGLLGFDIIVIIMTQSTALIFVLLAVFYQTHFSEEYVARKQQQKTQNQ
ncbi:DUF1189 domain-containing protein [Oceanobacillus alkalisoli]|uniref:DUF1189 domain-containing protein n=1 Tax=Oceanobacillus alkalisoli TaxID=2925113 RepID=UPI001EF00A93|nr:DUF1189 domain-containing protein [Oceanobacillus alkalisoli]MCF3944999.1 DUF1189 domain-containing protein [Oceanobacillus alkalisoli]MCG5103947.1 DUF1189 domain-containing protein [Oceanobacillus alkalisoli]